MTALASVLVVSAGAIGGTTVSPDRAADVERSWAAVPSPERRHGEVRLVQRGDAVVVQTVLYTKVLGQALGRIAEKERRKWDDSPTGREASTRYVTALRDALARLSRPDGEVPGEDRRRGLLIEFVLGPDEDVVRIGAPVVEERADGRLVVREVEPIAELDLARPYVRRNMELILEDSLGMTRVEAADAIEADAPSRP